MLLTLDVGNTQIHGGIFTSWDDPKALKFQFRKNTKSGASSDEIGVFLRSVLRENDFDPKAVQAISVCSVVPDLIHSLRGACTKYFGINPLLLQAGMKTGLKIRYRNPLEVGSDRIAGAIGATSLHPDKNLIIVDFGTATTFDAISSERDYLGGLILPGFRISMEALETKTARLPAVEIIAPEELIGRSTVESIQAGLYFGNLFALQGIGEEIRRRYFDQKSALIIGTGGFSRLFDREKVFDALIPELVLIGLQKFYALNR